MQRLITQLGTGSPTAGDDCAAVAGLNNLLDVSDGKVGPQHQSEAAGWIHWFRAAGGAPLTLREARARGRKNAGMLMFSEVLKAYRSDEVAKAFARHGLPRPHASYLFKVPWHESVPVSLAKHRNVHVGVMYGVLHKADVPTGSNKFKLGHSVILQDYAQDAEHLIRTHYGDSLNDGRPIPGPVPGHYPDGWQTIHLAEVQEAASAWAKSPGNVTYIELRKG